MLDLVHRSQKALAEVSRWDIMLGTFALKFEGGNYSKNQGILVMALFFSPYFIFFSILNAFNGSVSLKYPYLDTN